VIPHPLVEIWWHDAHPLTGWMAFDDIPTTPRVIRTAGYLVRDTLPGHYLVVQSVDVEASTFDAGIAVPIGMVVEIRYLAEL
jgi:hypothetical protein